MSTRAVVTIVCDQCAHTNQPEVFATTTFVVRIGNDPTRQIDLCDEHAGPVEALQALVRVRGARIETGRSDALVCPVCGQPCRNGTGLSAHQRARHGAAA